MLHRPSGAFTQPCTLDRKRWHVPIAHCHLQPPCHPHVHGTPQQILVLRPRSLFLTNHPQVLPWKLSWCHYWKFVSRLAKGSVKNGGRRRLRSVVSFARNPQLSKGIWLHCHLEALSGLCQYPLTLKPNQTSWLLCDTSIITEPLRVMVRKTNPAQTFRVSCEWTKLQGLRRQHAYQVRAGFTHLSYGSCLTASTADFSRSKSVTPG